MEELLEPGREVTIAVIGRMLAAEELPTRVIAADGKTISLAAPRRNGGQLVSIPVGSSVTFSFAREDAVYLCEGEVLEYERAPQPTVTLSRDGLVVKRLQRRSHYRLKTRIPVTCRRLGERGKEGEETLKWTQDISSGGAFLSDFCPEEVRIGDKLNLQVSLISGRDPVPVVGEVTRIVQDGAGRCCVGVTFADTGPDSRRTLAYRLFTLGQIQWGIQPDALIGETPQMLKLLEIIETAAKSESAVFVQGETGTGKELVARAIHSRSRRKGGPFIPVNCGAIVETLLESELFGHVKGAFSGAIRTNQGLFKAAEGGSIFLDEVTEISATMQVKLARVLQEKEIRPVGSSRKVNVDVRVISATNRDVKGALKKGLLRDDFFYRLYVIPIEVPPLRDRREDIPLLVDHFLRTLKHEANRHVLGVSPDAMVLLFNYDWPGNVRQLENVVERALALGKEELITVHDLPQDVRKARKPRTTLFFTNVPTLRENETALIRRALEECNGNRSRAAKLLGVDRKTLYRKITKYDLETTGRT